MIINKTMKNIRFYLLALVAMVFVACDGKLPGEDVPPPTNDHFEIEILDMHSSHCKVRVTPADSEWQYF